MTPQVEFRVGLGQRAAPCNKGEGTITMKAGHVLLAFGKVAWRQIPQGEDPKPESELLYKLSGSDDVVHHNNHMVSLRDVVSAYQQKHVNAKIAYHKMTEDTLELGAFKLVPTSQVAATFQPIKATGEGTAEEPEFKSQQHCAGTAIPLTFWDNVSYVMKLTWAVKWATQGLMPVRPVVILAEEVTLQKGECLKLWTEGSE